MNNRIILICSILLFSLVLFYATISLIKITISFAPDFNVYYGAANDIFHQKNPYIDTHLFTIFNYPLITAIFFIPFLLLPYQIAQAIFIVISFLAFCLIIILSLQMTKQLSLINFFLFFSLGFLSFPVKFTLGMGQSNLVAYALLLGGFYSFLKKRETYSFLLLLTAIILKPVLLVTLLFFFLRKSWRIVLGTVGVLSVIFFITDIFYPTEFTYYLIHIIPGLLNLSGREVYYNQGFTGFIARTIPHHMIPSLVPDIFAICMVSIVGLTITKTKK